MPRVPKALKGASQKLRSPERTYFAFCPTCGMQREMKPGQKIAWGNPRHPWEHRPHLGVIVVRPRPGVYETEGYFEPATAPNGCFAQVKEQLLAGLRAWYDKGWVTEEDLAAVQKGAEEPHGQA